MGRAALGSMNWPSGLFVYGPLAFVWNKLVPGVFSAKSLIFTHFHSHFDQREGSYSLLSFIRRLPSSSEVFGDSGWATKTSGAEIGNSRILFRHCWS